MRANKAPKSPTLPHQAVLKIPGRQGAQFATGKGEAGEADEEVTCDEAFLSACQLAVGPLAALREHAKAAVEKHLDSARPKRERKQRVISEAVF